MRKDLTNSLVDRRNILNNQFALKELYELIGFRGILFEGRYRFTKQQIAVYFEIDVRTLERLLESDEDELKESGYEVFKGQKLKDFKKAVEASSDGTDIDVGTIGEAVDNELINLNKSSVVSVFTFRAFLNKYMCLRKELKKTKMYSSD